MTLLEFTGYMLAKVLQSLPGMAHEVERVNAMQVAAEAVRGDLSWLLVVSHVISEPPIGVIDTLIDKDQDAWACLSTDGISLWRLMSRDSELAMPFDRLLREYGPLKPAFEGANDD